jgi:hypothetical protein
MKTSPKRNYVLAMLLALIWLIGMSCALLPSSSKTQPTNSSKPEETKTESSSQVQAETPAEAVQPTQEANVESNPDDEFFLLPDPLDEMLNLRSIQFELVTKEVDGATRTIEGEIDQAGNMHLKFTDPAFDTTGMPADFKVANTAPETELYVLDGKAYQPNDQDPAWKTTPVDEDFKANFSLELHGMESLASWLNLLPKGSVTADGSEEVGGFQTARFKVDGEISGERVFGTIWKDSQTSALIQAEIHVPAALLSTPDAPLSGEMLITLNVQKAEIQAIAP